MEKLFDYLNKEGRVVLQAPMIFCTATFICVAAAWTAINWIYSSKYEVQGSAVFLLKQTIEDRDLTISILRRQIEESGIDKLKAEILDLRNRLAQTSPRSLNMDQKQAIATRIKGLNGVIDILVDKTVLDAENFARDFAAAFTSGGWQVFLPIVNGEGPITKFGLSLQVENPTSLNAIEKAVRDALQKANISFEIIGGLRRRHSAGFGNTLGANVALMVTSRR